MLTRKLGRAHLFLTEIGDFARFLLAFDSDNGVTGVRRTVQPQYFDRDTGARFINWLPVFIEHGSHSTVLQTREDNIALLQCALLNQQ